MDPAKPLIEGGVAVSAGNLLAMALDTNAALSLVLSVLPVLIWRIGLIVAKILRESQVKRIERLRQRHEDDSQRIARLAAKAEHETELRMQAEHEAARLRELMADGECE